jgi:hypothetical protein
MGQMRIFSAMVVMTAVGSAHAQELAAPDAAHAPGFVTLLRQDATSRIGGDLTYHVLDNGNDVTLLRLDLHAHYVNPTSGFGGYAQLPVTFAFGNGDSETGLGGAELGGIFIPKLSSPDIAVVLRAGLALPTVSDDDGGFINLLATYLRPTDLYAQLPQAATLRLSASPMFRSGNFFARIDAGLDYNVFIDQGDRVDPAFLLNLGAGVDLGSVALMGELSTLVTTADNSDSLTSAALSLRGHSGPVQPYAALLIPVDDDVSKVFDLGLLAGLESRL